MQVKKWHWLVSALADYSHAENVDVPLGTSGCGKSTAIQLIERFYDANAGQLVSSIRGYSIRRDVRSSWLIPKIFEVSICTGTDHRVGSTLIWHSFVLFCLDCSWDRLSRTSALRHLHSREHRLWGQQSRSDPDERNHSSSKTCQHSPLHSVSSSGTCSSLDPNIELVVSLFEGYETNCGAKGTQLSGGQKQRIGRFTCSVVNQPTNQHSSLFSHCTSIDSQSEDSLARRRSAEQPLDALVCHSSSIVFSNECLG